MHKYLFTKHTKAMKKLTYLAVAAVALGVASCNTNKPGYVITGTVEGAADGGYCIYPGTCEQTVQQTGHSYHR